MSDEFETYFARVRNGRDRAAASTVFGTAELAKRFLDSQGLKPTAADVVALAGLILNERQPKSWVETAFENYREEP
jgi:hypothetical protein